MSGFARRGDRVSGGPHCHAPGIHGHAPPPTPGLIKTGSPRVYVDGRPAARLGDHGHSPVCCIGLGDILLQPLPGKVFVDGLPAATVGSPTIHCGMSVGQVATGSPKVRIA